MRRMQGLRSPETHRDTEGAPDTCSKGRASTKRQTMPVGILYTLLSIGQRRIDNEVSRREIPRISVQNQTFISRRIYSRKVDRAKLIGATFPRLSQISKLQT